MSSASASLLKEPHVMELMVLEQNTQPRLIIPIIAVVTIATVIVIVLIVRT
jgi:hypothetical protein